jgi:uncharacterized membrane protein
MKYFIPKMLIIIVAGLLLTNCQQKLEREPEVQIQNLPKIDKPTPLSKSASKPTDEVEPGSYCFDYDDKNLSATAQLLVALDKSVTGTIDATIHNAEASYYSSYNQKFAGILNKNKLDVNITTQIENDTQNSQEIWTLTQESLKTKQQNYQKIDCASLIR